MSAFAIGNVQLAGLVEAVSGFAAVRLVRHGDRLVEMRDRLLKGRSA
jgi:hypothetical protein